MVCRPGFSRPERSTRLRDGSEPVVASLEFVENQGALADARAFTADGRDGRTASRDADLPRWQRRSAPRSSPDSHLPLTRTRFRTLAEALPIALGSSLGSRGKRMRVLQHCHQRVLRNLQHHRREILLGGATEIRGCVPQSNGTPSAEASHEWTLSC